MPFVDLPKDIDEADVRDLPDGGELAWSGSKGRTYTLKRKGETYSCSCPSWVNQKKPIEERTCKHLMQLRGAARERSRIGGPKDTIDFADGATPRAMQALRNAKVEINQDCIAYVEKNVKRLHGEAPWSNGTVEQIRIFWERCLIDLKASLIDLFGVDLRWDIPKPFPPRVVRTCKVVDYGSPQAHIAIIFREASSYSPENLQRIINSEDANRLGGIGQKSGKRFIDEVRAENERRGRERADYERQLREKEEREAKRRQRDAENERRRKAEMARSQAIDFGDDEDELGTSRETPNAQTSVLDFGDDEDEELF